MKLGHPAYRVFALLAVFALWVLAGIFPLRKKLGELAGRQIEVEAKLTQYQKLAPQIPLWQVRRTELEQAALRLVSQLYTPAEAEKFLKDVMELARQAGLKVLDARPTFYELLTAVRELDSTRANLIRPVSFSLKLEGGYQTVASLVERLSGLPAYRGFFLTDLTRGTATGRVEANLTFYAYLVINPKPGA
jgi:Tfp pilus assembly protein PilO